jgi:hypothetical protein
MIPLHTTKQKLDAHQAPTSTQLIEDDNHLQVIPLQSKANLMSTLQYRTNASTRSAPSSINSTSTINSCNSTKSTGSGSPRRSGNLSIPSGSSHSVSSSTSRSNSRLNLKTISTNNLKTLLRTKMNRVSEGEAPQSLSGILRTQYSNVTSGFTSLSGSPPELWKAYLLKFLDSYAYFSFSLVFTLFLSSEFGMSDVQAGTIYGAWGALITVFGLFTGTVIDNLGVAMCLRIGFVLSFLTRGILFLCTSKSVLLVCTLVLLPLANCLGELNARGLLSNAFSSPESKFLLVFLFCHRCLSNSLHRDPSLNSGY